MEENTPAPKPARDLPFPIRLGGMRPVLQEEADKAGTELSPYIVSIIKNRHNTPQAVDQAENQKLKDRVEKQRILLEQCLKTFSDYGITTKSLRESLKESHE